MQQKKKSRWLTLREAGERYNVGRETVRLWIVRGIRSGDTRLKLDGKWIGGRWLVKRRVLRDFINAISKCRTSGEGRSELELLADQAEAARLLG